MTTNIHLSLASAAMILSACTSQGDGIRHPLPNVVIVITDDQGYGDLGFHGNQYVKTPAIDSFAEQAIRLTNFHVSPVCAPTRASLMTGRYALRTGVYDTYNGGAMMAGNEYTLAEMFKDAGYATGLFGKWHLGDNYPFRPMEQGFDEVLMHGAGGIGQPGDHEHNFRRDSRDSSYFDPVLYHNGIPTQFNGYCSDIFTDQAIQFIENNKDQPFFTYLSFNAPHTPLQVPEEYYNMYKDVEIDTTSWVQGFPVNMRSRDFEDAKKVWAMVTNIDDNFRRLSRKLDELGLAENTLVIFLTDNGPQQRRYNGGMRGLKSSVYEGGTRVPFFISPLGKISGDRDIDELTAHIDILPTLAEIAGITPPPRLDGQSLLPLLSGQAETLPARSIFLEWQRGFPSPYSNMAVINNSYKLVAQTTFNNQNLEGFGLYDVANDPFELVNLADSLPEKTRSMREEMDQYFDDLVTRNTNLKHQRIILGTPFENPTVLTKNDMHGYSRPWRSAEASAGYWDITISEAGKYRVKLTYEDNFSREGRVYARFNNIQRYEVNWDVSTYEYSLHPFHIPAGDYMLEAWYESGGKIFTPLYVEVEWME